MWKRLISNLSETKSKDLENLTKNKDLVMQKMDQSNTLDIINKIHYKTNMKRILYDSTKFEKFCN